MEKFLAKCTKDEAAAILDRCVGNTAHLVIALAKASDPEKTGGCFCFWREHEAGSVASFAVGLFNPTLIWKYKGYADEKAQRLMSIPGDISSWQSRNPDKKMFGGAIRLPNGLIFSFSGLSEHEDEMVCVLVADHLGLTSAEAVHFICSISGNKPLVDFYGTLASRPHPM